MGRFRRNNLLASSLGIFSANSDLCRQLELADIDDYQAQQQEEQTQALVEQLLLAESEGRKLGEIRSTGVCQYIIPSQPSHGIHSIGIDVVRYFSIKRKTAFICVV
ncbi:hypothetical protein ACP26L_01130 [Paenibacillus sp. S-38]|uniref:hypothetical protein n=1 Tax=Paenibacillus sp. S-38 TaxID=3416710 RepID=UPI003CEEA797